MSDPFIAEIKMFGGNFAPRGYAFCDGQLLPISQYTALFSLLGTSFGGDGRTTFGLPNLKDRIPIHAGRGPGLSTRILGQSGGSASVTLTEAQIPSHTHQLRASGVPANKNIPDNNASLAPPPAGRSSTTEIFHDAENMVAMNTVELQNTGGYQPHENEQPFQVINYIIALEGLYPSRN